MNPAQAKRLIEQQERAESLARARAGVADYLVTCEAHHLTASEDMAVKVTWCKPGSDDEVNIRAEFQRRTVKPRTRRGKAAQDERLA